MRLMVAHMAAACRPPLGRKILLWLRMLVGLVFSAIGVVATIVLARLAQPILILEIFVGAIGLAGLAMLVTGFLGLAGSAFRQREQLVELWEQEQEP